MKFLQKALRYIKNETNHKISVLMFDGFMIEPNNINEVDKQKLIKQLK